MDLPRKTIGKLLRPDWSVLQIVAGFGSGLILGIIGLRFSFLIVLWILAVAILVYAVLKRPELGLLCILIATSSILFEEQLPLISIGSLSFHIPDILLISLLSLIVLRRLANSGFRIVRTPLDTPLLIFYGVTLVSTLIALSQSSVDIVDARRAFRILSYYLTFFLVTNLIRERRQLNLLVNSFFLLATVVAAGMVAQYFLGRSVILLPGRVESLATKYGDVTRILPPGWSTILVSFVAILCILVLVKNKPRKFLMFLQCGLLGIAILFTFLRSYWIALIIVFFLLGYILKGYHKKKLIGWSLVAAFSIAIILLVVSSDSDSGASRLVDASIDRLSTLGKRGTFMGEDSSLKWRIIENKYAFSSIASSPLIGLGMGFTYRPWDPRLDPPSIRGFVYDLRKHIHNGHLWILLQSGLLGYLSLMWLSLAFLIRGFKYWRIIADDRMRGVVLGFTLVYMVVLIAAVANSTFMQWRWTPIIGIMMGINEIILMKVDKKTQPHNKPNRF